MNNGRIVLLVDDDTAIRDYARRVLEGQGHTVLQAQDGPEALQVANKHVGPIDLLLTDVLMPGMNGKALADRLIGGRLELKVLFMSGYADGVLNPGAAFLSKPFGPATLAGKVREVLDG